MRCWAFSIWRHCGGTPGWARRGRAFASSRFCVCAGIGARISREPTVARSWICCCCTGGDGWASSSSLQTSPERQSRCAPRCRTSGLSSSMWRTRVSMNFRLRRQSPQFRYGACAGSAVGGVSGRPRADHLERTAKKHKFECLFSRPRSAHSTTSLLRLPIQLCGAIPGCEEVERVDCLTIDMTVGSS
jgi:hypothetical protein